MIHFGSSGLFKLINLNITGGWEASLNQHKLKITSELITTANWTKQRQSWWSDRDLKWLFKAGR